jgi:hypothetical protein
VGYAYAGFISDSDGKMSARRRQEANMMKDEDLFRIIPATPVASSYINQYGL